MQIRREKLATLCFWIIFVMMLVLGRYTYQDYGITADEEFERKSAVINYQYVYEKLTGEHLGIIDQELHDYKDRYYGVALQIPMVIVEHLTDFTMPLREGFMLRHFYTFCVCMCGWLCFYYFCRIVFNNRLAALIGFLMITLYPRFWGEQFTNIKDMVFAATCCASMLAVALCLKHEGKYRYEVFGAFVFALCSNTRMIGFMYPALLFGYRLLRDLVSGDISQKRSKWIGQKLIRYFLNVLLMFGFYFLLSPVSWSNPLDFLKNVFLTFSNYTTWGGTVPFLSQMYPGNQLPGQYLLVWVAISVPLWYLGCMGIGLADGVCRFVSELRQKQLKKWILGRQRYLLFCLVTAAVPLLLPFFAEVTLYNGWRHMYFVFPSLVGIALFGLCAIERIISNQKMLRRIGAALLAVLMAGQIIWTVQNHPYEKVYFNAAGRKVADTVDRDYWAESSYEQLQVILRNDTSNRISLASDWIIGITVFNFLPQEQMNRFYVYYNGPQDVDYYLDAADTVVPEKFAGYTPVYEHRMRDGLLLSTIWIKNEVLEERFGGEYPEYNLK